MKTLITGILGAMLASAAMAQSVRVVDGDTLNIAGERVRIMGLDTPETSARCQREADLARQATAHMRQLVAGGITLRRQGQDRYGRTLAVVYDARGQDVARLMIAAGLARPYGGGRRHGWC